jgi:murein DD-endopeptidase
MIKRLLLVIFIAICIPKISAQPQIEPTTHTVPNDSAKQEWISRYMSVAYPLSKIVITSRYGYRHDPFTGKRTLHGGVDLRARYEPVYAILFGEITAIGEEPRGGKYVTIRHGAFTVTYRHLSKILVRKGMKVNAGDIVALSGNTGSRTTGPHLHLEVKYRGSLIDAQILLDFVTKTRQEALSHLAK